MPKKILQPIELLCPQCGLCCNGILFADVKLISRDDARRLKKLGLAIHKAGPRFYFDQPCNAFKNGRCCIYPDRPNRCAKFECRTLQRTLRGSLTGKDALEIIREARRQLRDMEKMLQKLKQHNDSLPLNQRYEAVFSEPWDLSQPARINRLRDQLYLASQNLAVYLEKHFLE